MPAKFLQGERPRLTADGPARPVLAKWITCGTNPFFARAMVNRFWYQMFGRGLVNPVDDMHDDNGPTHPELLAALTEQFTRNEFRHQVSAAGHLQQRDLPAHQPDRRRQQAMTRTRYSHRLVRVMSLSNCTIRSTRLSAASTATRDNPAPKKGPALTGRDAFTTFFRIDEGTDPLEYQLGIPQALRLMNSPQFNNNSAAVDQAMQSGKAPAEVIENLFLRTLSRRPTAAGTGTLHRPTFKAPPMLAPATATSSGPC